MPNKQQKNDSTILAYLIKDRENNYYLATLEDVTEEGLIFSVEKEYVTRGIFAEPYIDSRQFKKLGLTLTWVMEAPSMEQ